MNPTPGLWRSLGLPSRSPSPRGVARGPPPRRSEVPPGLRRSLGLPSQSPSAMARGPRERVWRRGPRVWWPPRIRPPTPRRSEMPLYRGTNHGGRRRARAGVPLSSTPIYLLKEQQFWLPTCQPLPLPHTLSIQGCLAHKKPPHPRTRRAAALNTRLDTRHGESPGMLRQRQITREQEVWRDRTPRRAAVVTQLRGGRLGGRGI